MSIVSNNIKYLRRLNGLTQEQFARKIAIKRSLLGAYEEARANPNITNLKNMAAAFGISVDNLLKNDLRRIRETPDLSLPLNSNRSITVSHSGQNNNSNHTPRVSALSEPQPLSKIMEKFQQVEPEIRTVSRQVNLKPVNGQMANIGFPQAKQTTVPSQSRSIPVADSAIPVFNNHISPNNGTIPSAPKANLFPAVQWVSQKDKNEYLTHLHNLSYITSLPIFHLPLLESGYYRAFEGGSDSPLPNAALIGTFIRNWYEIQDGQSYVLVVKQLGVLFRKTYNQVSQNGTLQLTSDLATIKPIAIPIQEVLEVWEVKAFFSTQLPKPPDNLEKIRTLTEQLGDEVKKLRS